VGRIAQPNPRPSAALPRPAPRSKLEVRNPKQSQNPKRQTKRNRVLQTSQTAKLQRTGSILRFSKLPHWSGPIGLAFAASRSPAEAAVWFSSFWILLLFRISSFGFWIQLISMAVHPRPLPALMKSSVNRARGEGGLRFVAGLDCQLASADQSDQFLNEIWFQAPARRSVSPICRQWADLSSRNQDLPRMPLRRCTTETKQPHTST
jgi:hypothetical protein